LLTQVCRDCPSGSGSPSPGLPNYAIRLGQNYGKNTGIFLQGGPGLIRSSSNGGFNNNNPGRLALLTLFRTELEVCSLCRCPATWSTRTGRAQERDLSPMPVISGVGHHWP
jgi:hypothetical protein